MKKRTFLLTAVAAAGALIVGWGVMPPRQRLQGSNPLPVKDGQVALNGWIKLYPDGTVGLIMPRSEMGQGIHTGLAMLVAEELDCTMAQIRIEPAGIDKIYGNVAGMAEGVPFHPEDQGVIARSMRWTMHKVMREMGFMMTGGSASIKDLWFPLREAAAMTKASLINALALHWKVGATQIQPANGVFSVGADKSKSMALGEVVKQLGSTVQPATSYTLKPATQFTLIGKSISRIDSADKVNAKVGFGIDTLAPGMLYAAVKMAPSLRGSVASMNISAAEKMPGVKKVVSFEGSQDATGGVAVVADHYWRARKALDAVKIEWKADPSMAALSSADALKAMSKALDSDTGFGFYKIGDVDAAMASASTRIKAEYTAPYLAHAPMEPMNCTVELKDGKATVWAATQVPDFARTAAAKALGISAEAVTVHVTYLGGGFGRRLEVDVIAAAASVAKQHPGQAIQMIWSREEDMKHDFYRPAAVARFEAGFNSTGGLVAWRNVSAAQNIVPQFMSRNAGLPMGGPDKTSSEGAFDQAYEFTNARVGHVAVDLPTPIGFFRAVGHSHQGFFKEGFIDECAGAAKQDPYQFRSALLKKHPRHKAVLDLAASKAGWGTPLAAAADGSKKARGIALHESFGSIVAQVAEVSVSQEGAIRVHRVVCAVDCGLAVNPNLIAQQMESAVIFGLSAALYGKIDIVKGEVQQSNYHDYSVMRFGEAPVVETHIVPSTSLPEGIGEPGLPPVAPALANALFALTGKRLRSLPLSLASV
jgi:isoquinoline 1-oxidoreductase subunit beta